MIIMPFLFMFHPIIPRCMLFLLHALMLLTPMLSEVLNKLNEVLNERPLYNERVADSYPFVVQGQTQDTEGSRN